MRDRLLTLAVVIGVLWVAPSQVPATETMSLAQFGPARQAMVSAGLGAEDERYHARPESDGYVLASPAQGLTASLDGSGIEVKGSSGEVGMRVLGWGCEATLASATGWRAGAAANRVEIAREGITEWYVAGPMGVEQGFTVAAPTAGCEAAGELVIELSVAGSTVLGADGRSLDFPEARLRYRGLLAVDAAGRELPARLELAGQRLGIRAEVAGARWPVTVDPTFEVAKLLASDGAPDDEFGISVAVSGRAVVVGTCCDSLNPGGAKAYVFTEPVGGWAGTLNEAAKLLASDGAAGDAFGASVAISGSTVVVGAFNDDDNGVDSGSAYVFTEPVGGWTGTVNEAAKLLASDGVIEDRFGGEVAVSGSTVVVGATGDDDNGQSSGSAYVFTEPVGGWAGILDEAAKLLASDGGWTDFFGISVAVSGSTVFVGASFQNFNTGSAYVFVEPVGGWAGILNEAAKLLASDGIMEDRFGESIGVSSSTVFVGALGDFDNGPGSGSVYVFSEPVGGWTGTLNEAGKLLASDGAARDWFGGSVAVSGSTVVVGAAGDDDNGVDSGSAYMFTEPVGGWTGTVNEAGKLLASDGAGDDLFGWRVAASGSTVVVGAIGDDDNGDLSGSAYVYSGSGPPGPQIIFADDFESGDTSAWSNTVP